MSTMMRNTNGGSSQVLSGTTESEQGARRADESNAVARVNVPLTRTAIEECVQAEVRRYLDMLDGEEPSNLYRMVIRQTESAVINLVMSECRGNRTRAAEWLGISRGNLRSKLANMEE